MPSWLVVFSVIFGCFWRNFPLGKKGRYFLMVAIFGTPRGGTFFSGGGGLGEGFITCVGGLDDLIRLPIPDSVSNSPSPACWAWLFLARNTHLMNLKLWLYIDSAKIKSKIVNLNFKYKTLRLEFSLYSEISFLTPLSLELAPLFCWLKPKLLPSGSLEKFHFRSLFLFWRIVRFEEPNLVRKLAQFLNWIFNFCDFRNAFIFSSRTLRW